jgi:F-type H+-transporting ATPase subunit b
VEINATFLIQLVLFLLLFVWLSQFLFAPFLRLFDERERRIVGAADEAKRYLGSADEKTALVEQKTREAQAEARKLLTDLRTEGARKEAEIIDEGRKKAQARLDEARAELFASTEEARAALKADSEKIAADIVVKILGRAA